MKSLQIFKVVWISLCKSENGNLVTDPERVEKQFSSLLQGDGDTNTAIKDIVPNSIDNDGMVIPPPSHEEV